jgi:hypothetical protein
VAAIRDQRVRDPILERQEQAAADPTAETATCRTGHSDAASGMPTPLFGGPAHLPVHVPTPAGITVFAAAREETTATQHHGHSGDGRRDLLPPHERTRILRMLRDEGAQDEYTDQSFDLGSIPLRPSIPAMPDEWALPPAGPVVDRPRTSTHPPIIVDEESEQVHIGSMPPRPLPSVPKPAPPRAPSKPIPKFVDGAKTEIASFEHLHGDATTPERRWPEVSTDPHVPDGFDKSNDD